MSALMPPTASLKSSSAMVPSGRLLRFPARSHRRTSQGKTCMRMSGYHPPPIRQAAALRRSICFPLCLRCVGSGSARANQTATAGGRPRAFRLGSGDGQGPRGHAQRERPSPVPSHRLAREVREILRLRVLYTTGRTPRARSRPRGLPPSTWEGVSGLATHRAAPPSFARRGRPRCSPPVARSRQGSRNTTSLMGGKCAGFRPFGGLFAHKITRVVVVRGQRNPCYCPGMRPRISPTVTGYVGRGTAGVSRKRGRREPSSERRIRLSAGRYVMVHEGSSCSRGSRTGVGWSLAACGLVAAWSRQRLDGRPWSDPLDTPSPSSPTNQIMCTLKAEEHSRQRAQNTESAPKF